MTSLAAAKDAESGGGDYGIDESVMQLLVIW